MSAVVASVLGSAFILWYVFAVVLLVAIGALYPLLALSITRNIKGIRQELERLNTNLEREPTLEQRSNIYTRTGSLNIR